MVVEWIQKQCDVAWALDFRIRCQNLQLDSVWTLAFFTPSILVFSFMFIFQYGLADGNGFKTGSMRLGADAIVFSCHMKNM
jgi:hypothetical protein